MKRTLGLFLLLVSLLYNPTIALAETTMIKPGSFVFIKMKSEEDQVMPRIFLLEFDRQGKGALMSELDKKRVLTIIEPESLMEIDLDFHYYREYHNYFRRAKLSKIISDIDAGELGFWNKVKAYSKELGAWTADKLENFNQWFQETSKPKIKDWFKDLFKPAGK